MEDLLQSQIRDSCRLALPEGLKDLMCDISREVLRAKPADLYQFIVDYLSALLLSREALSIACRVCNEVSEGSCQPDLEEELKNIGLVGEELETAKNVVMKHFDKGEVKEANLLMKLLNKTKIDENVLPLIQNAVRVAFMKNQLEHQIKLQEKAGEANVSGNKAAKHTLRLYEAKFDQNILEKSAIKIQDKVDEVNKAAEPILRLSESEIDQDLKDTAATKIQTFFRAYLTRRYLVHKMKNTIVKGPNETMKKKSSRQGPSKLRGGIGRLSSTSLAGSWIHLPKYIPYSAHDLMYVEFEERETERNNIDYTLERNFKDLTIIDENKIEFDSYQTIHKIESRSVEDEAAERASCLEEEAESCLEEEIVDEILSDTNSVDENITENKSLIEDFVQAPIFDDIINEQIQPQSDDSDN